MTTYFDRAKINLKPLAERRSDLDLGMIKEIERQGIQYPEMNNIAEYVIKAKSSNAPVIFMMGGHVVRSGVQKYLIDLLEKGYVTCCAVNGAVMIHDYELSLIGKTTESVARYIREGQFGLWKETGYINDIINSAHQSGTIGMGFAIGKAIHEGDYPYKNISLFAACYRLGIPITVHVGIGYDIIHEHANFDGAAAGATSYTDFLKLAHVIQNIEGGVVINFGSAVMAPEVFLKALSMARNVAHLGGRTIKDFTTVVCDLYDLPDNIGSEPCKTDVHYYFRPWKTMLARTVSDGGRSFYVKGRHEHTIPSLWEAIMDHGQA